MITYSLHTVGYLRPANKIREMISVFNRELKVNKLTPPPPNPPPQKKKKKKKKKTSKFSEFSSPAFEICFEGYYL